MDGENILTEFWWEASSNELLRGSDILDDFEVFHAIPKLNVHLIELWALVRLDILTENQKADKLKKCTEILADVLQVNRSKMDQLTLNFSPELPIEPPHANKLMDYIWALNICLMCHKVVLPAQNFARYECPYYAEDRLKTVLNDILQFIFIASERDLRTLAKMRFRDISPITAAECEENQTNIFNPNI